MCQTHRSLFNVDSFVIHPGLITRWMALVMIVDSAPRYENLISEHCLHHVGACMCKPLLCNVTSDLLSVLFKSETPPSQVFVVICPDRHALSYQDSLKYSLLDFHLKCKAGA